MERIEATVLGTVYRNSENGYSVVTIQVGRGEQTAVGSMPTLHPGEQAAFTGEWVEHTQYGRQFKCVSCEPITPTTLLGIERFLASGVVKGVGPSTAKTIVAAFGEETLSVLTEHPERLQELPGMGKKRWRMIAENFREANEEREAMIFLQSYGIPATLAARIGKLYGDTAREVIRTNPYRLCDDLEGVGFVTADRIATAMGVPPDSPGRIRAALRYLLQEAAAGSGHVFLWRDELTAQAGRLLRVGEELIAHEMQAMLIARDLLARLGGDREQIWLPAFDRAEREVAQRLCELIASAPPPPVLDADGGIDRYEREQGIRFSERQRDAIRSAMRHGVLVITGGPGTGKTTIINCILRLISAEGGISMCAPTGRAAKRMTETTGMESKTIHRLLEYGGEEGAFARDAEHPLECSCLIVDEASMIDVMLMRSLLRAVEPGTRLIIVGDSDQLPSVGPGNVLGDILRSGVVPSVRLTDIFRQADTSRIVINAHRINRGDMPLLNEKDTDFFFERTESASRTADKVVALIEKRLPGYLKLSDAERSRRIQVLAPARKGECGVIALNQRLQETLNPPRPGQDAITWGEKIFRVGDKVMQTHNDYQIEWMRPTRLGWDRGQGVFNGDVGYVTETDLDEHTLTVRFDEDKEVVYSSADLENLELAYCMSVHKSQGSEFPAVVMPVFGGPVMLLTRNLFYTALTRAKELVVLVGSEATIRQMVENDHILQRNTALAERLTEAAAMIHR